MRTVVCSLLLLAATLVLVPARPAAAGGGGPSYVLEQFPFPPNLPGLSHGEYSAISNHARLASAYTDPDFDTVGVIEVGNQSKVFRVGTPLEEYTWYRGINDRLTTVGFQTTAGGNIAGWMRRKNGQVRTFHDPNGDVYLYRLNDQDVAVGEVVYSGSQWRPVIVDRRGLRVVTPPGVAPGASAYFAGINNAGAIVGGTTDPDTHKHTCLLWKNGTATPITYEAAGHIAPRAINTRGQIAGYWVEKELDPDIGDFRRHGFIREPDGEFRTVDVEFPFEEAIEFEPGVLAGLVGQTTEILDLNDRGQIVIQATGWYGLGGFVFPIWTYAIATPSR
jgi:hypothetical protein